SMRRWKSCPRPRCLAASSSNCSNEYCNGPPSRGPQVKWRRTPEGDGMKKIAVVEDNPDNRLLVRVLLDSQYEVAEYETGSSALEGFKRHLPDLVLLAVSLPEIDGPEVLRRIRSAPRLRELPVIALTAHAMATDREKFLAAGFDDYITKPIVDENVLL